MVAQTKSWTPLKVFNHVLKESTTKAPLKVHISKSRVKESIKGSRGSKVWEIDEEEKGKASISIGSENHFYW